MSKAFTKEDDDIPEQRVGRARSSSGLPPGTVNYMTEVGARRLHEELKTARGQRAAELRRMLDSAVVIPTAEAPPNEVLFGVKVTVRKSDGELVSYRIVGVDEAGLGPGWMSWLTPLAKALIGTKVGERPRLPGEAGVEIVEVVEISQ